jgi:hypothetical protein
MPKLRTTPAPLARPIVGQVERGNEKETVRLRLTDHRGSGQIVDAGVVDEAGAVRVTGNLGSGALCQSEVDA